MRRVLVTGFEPFGGERLNASWEVVKCLEGLLIKNHRIVVRRLPCVFDESRAVLNAAIEEVDPVRVLAVGQASGRTDITVERIAININDARIADNCGQQPVDLLIEREGPAAYFSTLPIKAIVDALIKEGIPASVSQTAGTFVCNHVMYGLLHNLSARQEVRGGFIHVPCLPEQSVSQAGMAAPVIQRALEIAILISLSQSTDLSLPGGAMY